MRRRSHGHHESITAGVAVVAASGHVAVGRGSGGSPGPEQQLLLLSQLPPQSGVLGAQHGVVAAQAGHLAVAPLRGVALPPARLPGERLGGAPAGGLGGVGLDELSEVGHPEDEVQRPEVVHPVRREVGGQLAVGLALAPLVLAHRARAAAAAAGHARRPSPLQMEGREGERDACVYMYMHIWNNKGQGHIHVRMQESKVRGGSQALFLGCSQQEFAEQIASLSLLGCYC